MAKIKFNKKRFEKIYALTDKIQEQLSLFGTPVESVTETEIELEISANRPDLLSAEGFLRAFNAFMGKEIGLKKYTIKSDKKFKVIVDKSVKEIRPYTVCAVVKNLDLTKERIEELMKLQEKLHITQGRNRKKAAIGIYVLDKIIFPVTFRALPAEEIMFIPLGMDKPLPARIILQKHPKGKEYGKLIEDLTRFPVLMDARKNILSMPPIINSNESGQITSETKEVFIECSGNDKKTLELILNNVVTTLAEMGGTIYGVDVYDGKEIETYPSLRPFKMPFSNTAVKKLIGITVNEKDMKKLVERMGYEYNKTSVLVPSWRADVLHEVDVIEDVAIAYGYDKLIPQSADSSLSGEQSPENHLRTLLSDLLIGLGMQELSSLHFITEEEASEWDSEAIKVINAKTEYTRLRPSLMISLIRTLSQNKGAEYPQRVYELGKVFSNEETISEREHLAFALAPGNFTLAKQSIEYVLRSLGLRTDMKESTEPHCIAGRVGRIYANETEIGYIGELTPHILSTNKINVPVAVAEINVEALRQMLYPR